MVPCTFYEVALVTLGSSDASPYTPAYPRWVGEGTLPVLSCSLFTQSGTWPKPGAQQIFSE